MGCAQGEQPSVSEEGVRPAPYLPPWTPLSSAANIRSVHIVRSTQSHRSGLLDEARLAVAGTRTPLLTRSHPLDLAHPPSCPPSLRTGCVARASRECDSSAVGRDCSPARWLVPLHTTALGRPTHRPGTTRALTPARLTPTNRPPRLSRVYVPTFRLQPRGWPVGRFARHLQRLRCVSGFALS